MNDLFIYLTHIRAQFIEISVAEFEHSVLACSLKELLLLLWEESEEDEEERDSVSVSVSAAAAI